MTFVMSLNDRISKIIEYSGFTPSEFADEIDVQRSSISHITSGRNKPSLDFLMKVKDKFPDLDWDWMIYGTGEMLVKKENEKTSSLPDLFSIINDDKFGLDSEEKPQNSDSRDFSIPQQRQTKEILNDSHQLETIFENKELQKTENQGIKIVRVIIFYENGKFDSFEP